MRLTTLRSVYMDLASDFGAQKFRWIMVVHDHGDPAHNQALDQASDYFRDIYGGTMLHLFGLTEVQGCYGISDRIFREDSCGKGERSVCPCRRGRTQRNSISASGPGESRIQNRAFPDWCGFRSSLPDRSERRLARIFWRAPSGQRGAWPTGHGRLFKESQRSSITSSERGRLSQAEPVF